MKTCPFCAEEIQDAAIVCKHCGRELDSRAVEQVKGELEPSTEAPAETVLETRPEWENLPRGYSPPSEHIEAIHRAEQEALRNGGWLEATIPGRPPRSMQPKKYAKFQKDIAEKGWKEGGYTAEGAEKWLTNYSYSERDADKSEAAHFAMLTFHNRTKTKLSELYVYNLERVLRRMMNSVFGKSEILEQLDNHEAFDEQTVKPEYRPYVFDEAKRYVTGLPDFARQELAPAPTADDFARVKENVIALLEQWHITPDLREHGYEGVVSEEELDRAIDLMTEGDPKFTKKGHRSMVSLRVRDTLKSREILIGTQAWLETNKYR